MESIRPENGCWLSTNENVSRMNLQSIENGIYHLLGREIQARTNANRVKNGTHNFLGSDKSKGTVNVLDVELQKMLR